MNVLELEVRSRVDPCWWNGLVHRVPWGTIYQTTYWRDYLLEIGADVYFFLARDRQGEVAGTLLAWVEPLRGLRPAKWLTGGALRSMTLSHAFWMYGPLVFSANEPTMTEMLALVDEFFKKQKLLGLRYAVLPLHGLQGAAGGPSECLRFSREPWATFLVDLAPSPGVLWRSLKPSARKAVKKCQRDGVWVERLRESELPQYEALLREAIFQLHLPAPPYFPNAAMWKHLRSEQPCLEVFVAKKAGRLLGGLGVLAFNGILFEIGAARGVHSLRENLPVQDLIKWEIISWGHQQGHRLYDVSGVAPRPSTAKARGIRQFKAKWGGRYVEYSAFAKSYSSAYTAGLWIRRELAALFDSCAVRRPLAWVSESGHRWDAGAPRPFRL